MRHDRVPASSVVSWRPRLEQPQPKPFPGARGRPELVFELRGVDQGELIARAGKDLPLARKGPAAGRVRAEEGLSELFGIDLAEVTAPASAKPRRTRPPAKPAAGKPKPRPVARLGSRGAGRR